MGILDAFRLTGKVALVTGVGRGLGQAMALGLAEAGADIAGLYHTRYAETQAQVEALGRRFLPLQADLGNTTPEKLGNTIETVLRELGRLDILLNNAGVIRRGPALALSEQDWDDVLQVNLKSLFFLSQAAARVMAQQNGGKIINIASMLSFQGGVRVLSYTAAKSGVAGLTKALANEWAPRGINVNAIAPGYMATDLTEPLQTDSERNEDIVTRIPAGRWGGPDDLKGAAVFLASPAADYMHGAIVPVDGGWLAR